MKVVIADDEEHVRKGIDLAVDWVQFGITERFMADNGIQAMELVRKHQPVILFCDMSMPQMDGIQLLQSLRDEGWDTQVIVVSGYADYSFTRAALLANGVDYILKPFKTKDLEEAVYRAVTASQAIHNKSIEELEKRHRLRLADSLLDEQKLVEFLKGNVVLQDETLRNLFHKIGLPAHNLSISFMLPRNKTRLIDGRFVGDIGLFQFAVNNIAQEILKSHVVHYLCRLDEYQWILIMTSTHSDNMKNEYNWYLKKLEQAWRETLGLEVLQGTFISVADTTQLLPAVAEARASLLKSELLKGSINPTHELPRWADREILLMNAIQRGHHAGLTDIIGAFVQALHACGSLRLEQLQVYTMEANLLVKRIAGSSQTNKDRIDGLLSLWISDLDEWQAQLEQRCWEMAEYGNDQSLSFGIEGVYQYIHKHYQEQISLSTLAEAFHFSPQHLTRKFKEQYHTTIMSCLTSLRMEKAISLLIHSDAPIAELANSLGYEDENYFSKVFKKQTGLSPIQFRKHNRDR